MPRLGETCFGYVPPQEVHGHLRVNPRKPRQVLTQWPVCHPLPYSSNLQPQSQHVYRRTLLLQTSLPSNFPRRRISQSIAARLIFLRFVHRLSSQNQPVAERHSSLACQIDVAPARPAANASGHAISAWESRLLAEERSV